MLFYRIRETVKSGVVYPGTNANGVLRSRGALGTPTVSGGVPGGRRGSPSRVRLLLGSHDRASCPPSRNAERSRPPRAVLPGSPHPSLCPWEDQLRLEPGAFWGVRGRRRGLPGCTPLLRGPGGPHRCRKSHPRTCRLCCWGCGKPASHRKGENEAFFPKKGI